MRILAFGDSNTYGSDPRGFFSDRYQSFWSDLLAQKTGWEVVNGGSNGRALPGCDRWIDAYMRKHTPVDQIVIMMGTNDILQGHCPERILADMEALLSHIQTAWPNARIILLSPLQITIWGENYDAQLQAVTEGYCRMAQQRGIPFADVRTWNLPMAFDGIHLSEEGQGLFAERLIEEYHKWVDSK